MAQSLSGISFGGLFSGLDTESIIEKLLQIERQPITLLENKKTKLNYQKTNLNTVNSALLALNTTLSPMKTDIAAKRTATSSDESIVRATADVSASVSSYVIDVISKAYEHRVASDKQATGYTVGGAADFDLTIDGKTFTVSLAGGETLSQVAQKINTSLSGGDTFMTYAEAFVVTDPHPVTGGQTLVIESKNTGTTNAITFTDTDGWLNAVGFASGAAWNGANERAATDAELTIDGVTVKSPSNSVTGAIVGVNFTVLKDTGTVTVTVGNDDDTVVEQVKAFVEQFNKVTDMIDGYVLESQVAGATTEEDLAKGVLRGDLDLSMIKGDIRLYTTGYMESDTSISLKILSQIGIDSEASSGSMVSDQIELDEEKLRDALATDREDVSALLANFADQLSGYLEEQTKVSVSQADAGTFYQRILGIDTQIDAIDDDISNWEERVTAEESRLRNSFTMMEELLQQMQSQSSYLQTQLSNLVKSTSTSK